VISNFLYFYGMCGLIKEWLIQRYFSKVCQQCVKETPVKIYVTIDLYLQVQACGSLVTEEQPHAMLLPLEYFLVGYGLYRPSRPSCSPRSPLSPSCISPELLSPESMGVKLKPIKTRITLEV
ncbi:hypothetical protein BHE74_00005659, partial [Ensete ventricosum]